MDFLFPSLKTDNPAVNQAFRVAIGDLTGNIQPYKNGLLQHNVPCIVPSLDGHDLMTMDASINVWNGAALLMPKISKNTLLSVLTRDAAGKVRIMGENLDEIIWVTAAWQYYLMTADKDFLRSAFEASRNSLQHYEETKFDKSKGLFRSADPILFSTNCLFANAYTVMPFMEKTLGWEHGGAWVSKAKALKASINRKFWDKKKGVYLSISGEKDEGDHLEDFGNSLALLFDIMDAKQKKSLFSKNRGDHIKKGQTVQSFWADACAYNGKIVFFGKALSALASHFIHVEKISNRETSNATGYIHAILSGLCGMRFSIEGLNFEPTLPDRIKNVVLSGFHYMDAVIDIRISGSGKEISSMKINGKDKKNGKLPMRVHGHFDIAIILSGKKVKGGYRD